MNQNQVIIIQVSIMLLIVTSVLGNVQIDIITLKTNEILKTWSNVPKFPNLSSLRLYYTIKVKVIPKVCRKFFGGDPESVALCSSSLRFKFKKWISVKESGLTCGAIPKLYRCCRPKHKSVDFNWEHLIKEHQSRNPNTKPWLSIINSAGTPDDDILSILSGVVPAMICIPNEVCEEFSDQSAQLINMIRISQDLINTSDNRLKLNVINFLIDLIWCLLDWFNPLNWEKLMALNNLTYLFRTSIKWISLNTRKFYPKLTTQNFRELSHDGTSTITLFLSGVVTTVYTCVEYIRDPLSAGQKLLELGSITNLINVCFDVVGIYTSYQCKNINQRRLGELIERFNNLQTSQEPSKLITTLQSSANIKILKNDEIERNVNFENE